MAKASEIRIGMHVRFGVDHAREVEVIGDPENGRVRVRYATGDEADVPVSLCFVQKKRPSARRKVTLKGVVDCFNEGLDEDARISPELFEDKCKKWGLGK